MTTPEGFAFWIIAIVGAVAYEIFAVFTGKATPLTNVARATLLKHPIGSAVIGGFGIWLFGWHWLLDQDGLGWEDLAALVVGAIAGLMGWKHRTDTDKEG